MSKELIRYKDKKNFALFEISQLYNSDFDRKTEIFISKPPLVATLLATLSALFALLSRFSISLSLALANISSYLI